MAPSPAPSLSCPSLPPSGFHPSFSLSTLLSVFLFLSLLCPVSVVSVDPCVGIAHAPLPLIRFDMSSSVTSDQYIKMEPVDSTMKKLSEIKGRVAIVSISGPYRTGKSWFLSQLLPPQHTDHHAAAQGFEVGDTTEAHTQDVEVHIVPACALREYGLKDEDLTVLFMDTPGLFSPDRKEVFDSQLLALLNLISSVLLYNTQDVVDRKDIQQLASAMDTAFVLSFFQSNEAGLQSRELLDRPHLLWLLQNFHLKMATGETPKQFIIKKFNQTDAQRTDKKAGVSYVDKFEHFFASIDAQILPWPTEHTKDIESLGNITWDGLTKEYQQQIQKTRELVLTKTYAKNVASTEMTGELLVNMIRSWIEIMAVKVSDLREQSTQTLLNGIIQKEVTNARGVYATKIAGVTLPVSAAELKRHSDTIKADIIKGKEKIPQYLQSIDSMVNEEFAAAQSRNQQQITSTTTKLIAEQTDKLKQTTQEKLSALKKTNEPFSADKLTDIETTLMRDWSVFVSTLIDASTTPLVSQAEKSLRQWWLEQKDAATTQNLKVSEAQCMKRAEVVVSYYKTVRWWTLWQTEDVFQTLISSIQLAEQPVPAYMVDKSVHGSRETFPCDPSSARSAAVQEQYDEARHAFLIKHRYQVFVAAAFCLLLYGLALFSLTRLNAVLSASSSNSLQHIKPVDDAEGYRPYIYLLAAAAGVLLWLKFDDGIWNIVVHATMMLALLTCAVVGLKLRWNVNRSLSKYSLSNKV